MIPSARSTPTSCVTITPVIRTLMTYEQNRFGVFQGTHICTFGSLFKRFKIFTSLWVRGHCVLFHLKRQDYCGILSRLQYHQNSVKMRGLFGPRKGSNVVLNLCSSSLPYTNESHCAPIPRFNRTRN